MRKLAIFDIDYTITKRETLMELFKFAIKKDRSKIKFIPRAIYCGVMYSIGLYDEKIVKESFLKFISGISKQELAKLARSFYEERLITILYEDALNMIRKLKNEGYDIYLISASPEFYIKEFYNIKEVHKVIGTRFYFAEGVFTGKMKGKNCKGQEKVRRLKEFLQNEKIEVDFKQSYMFSDSMSDKPLLDLVGHPYLINYKKKKGIEILKWK